MRLLFSLPLATCAAMTMRCRRLGRTGYCAPSASEVDSLQAESAELRALPANAEAGR